LSRPALRLAQSSDPRKAGKSLTAEMLLAPAEQGSPARVARCVARQARPRQSPLKESCPRLAFDRRACAASDTQSYGPVASHVWGLVVHEYAVPLLNVMFSRSSPAARSSPELLVPWKLPLNV